MEEALKDSSSQTEAGEQGGPDEHPRRMRSPGRPKKTTKRDIRIQVLFNEEEYKLFVKAKERAGFESDSGYARMAVMKQAGKQK